MKSTLLNFTLLVLISLTFFNINLVAESRKTVRFATLAPKSSSWGKLITTTSRDIYKASKKRIVFKVFYGGVQGDEDEMEEKIRFKQLDGAFFTGNGLGAAVYETRVLEVPGLIRNYKELDHVYENIIDSMNVYYNQKGYQLLGLVDVGYAHFFSKQNITSLADIKNTKMWNWKGDRLSSEIMKLFDIPAVPVSFSEVIPSLQTGLIDGVYATTTSLLSLQWHREVNYMLDTPITLASSGAVLSKALWDELSADDRKIIQEAINKNFANFKPIIRKSDKDALTLLKKEGLVINKGPDNVKEIAEKAKVLLSEFPKPLTKEVISLINEVRK